VRNPLGDVRADDAGLVAAALVLVPDGHGVTGGRQVAGVQVLLVVDRVARRRGGPLADELRLDQHERRSRVQLVVDGGDLVGADEAAHEALLRSVVPAVDVLVLEDDVLEGQRGGVPVAPDAAVEADDVQVSDIERPDFVGVAQVQAYHAPSVPGTDAHVAHRALVVGDELDADRAGVAAAGVDRQVADRVAEALGGRLAGPEHGARGGRVGEGGMGVRHLQHGLVPSGALQDLALLRHAAVASAAPAQRVGDAVHARGQIQDLVRGGCVVERLLDRRRAVLHAGGVGMVGCRRQVDDARIRREGHFRRGELNPAQEAKEEQ